MRASVPIVVRLHSGILPIKAAVANSQLSFGNPFGYDDVKYQIEQANRMHIRGDVFTGNPTRQRGNSILVVLKFRVTNGA